MSNYTVPLSKLDEVHKRINKANKRLKKAGSNNIFTIKEDHVTIPHDGKFVQAVNVTLNIPTIEAGNHEIVAAVDILDNGTVLRTLDNVDADNLPRPTEHTCEYCGTKRSRKNSYLLRNKDTGEISHIGKSCLEVFTGVSPAIWTLDINFEDLRLSPENYGEYAFPMYSVRDIIKASYAASHGGEKYVSQSKAWDKGIAPTSEVVRNMLNNASTFKTNELETLRNIASEVDNTTVDEIITKIDNVEGDYGENLRVIIASEYVSPKHFNMAVSIVASYYNEHKRAEREAEQNKAKNNLMEDTLRAKIKFPPKAKIENIPVTVSRTTSYERMSYNHTGMENVALIVFIDDEGNNFVWHSSSKKAFNLKTGDKGLLTGTVKDHNTFNNQFQIIVTRAKLG